VSYRSLVLLVVVLGVGAMALRPSFDTDTWWHLRAGQWIVDNREVPKTDPFSHTMQGGPWAYPGWLAQVVMLGFFRLGGLQGLTLFTAFLVAIGLAFLWSLLDGALLLRAAVLLLAAATSAVYWAARPHVASFALAAFFLWALEGRRGGRRPKLIWLLPLAMALWTNVHGGFVIGFLLTLMYLAGTVVDMFLTPLLRRGLLVESWRRHRSDVVALVAVFLLSLLAAGINPHGLAILLYPIKTLSIPVLQANIQEWQSPDFQQANLLPFLVMLLTLIVALGASGRAASATELIAVGGSTAIALLAVRNVPFFALAAAPVISRQASAALETIVHGLTVPAAEPWRGRRLLHGFAGAILILACLGWAAVQLSAKRSQDHLQSLVPLGAFEALKGARPPGQLFNDYNWGGYALWDLYPSYPTFVDGRTDIFPPRIFEDYIRLWNGRGGWEALLDQYGIGIVLLPPQAPLTEVLERAGWDEMYRDRTSVILLRPPSGAGRAP
jgi:hypothetical protein